MPRWFELEVNGRPERVFVEPDATLLYVLRNDLGLTAAKFGCGLEQCNACTVIVEGEAVTSCATAIDAVAGKRVTTLEGIGTPDDLHPVQQAFLDEQAAQCGFCVPGMIVRVKAMLDRSPQPSEEQIAQALEPHLCRCGSHPRMIKAVRRAAAGR